MTAAVLTQVTALLDQVDRLKAMHRAGDGPSFGQVEALFDQAAVVRAALASPADPSRPAPWPTHPTPLGFRCELAARVVSQAVVQAMLSLQAGPSTPSDQV